MAAPGLDATILDCSPSPPISSHLSGVHIDAMQELVAATTIGCLTDGLVERRSEVRAWRSLSRPNGIPRHSVAPDSRRYWTA